FLVSLYVSLGRHLVPLVAAYRPEVQDRASALRALPVSLGRPEGGWSGVAPRPLASDVVLGAGGAAVRQEWLELEPDIATSLWSRRVYFKSVELAGIHLSLVQNSDGQWRIEGLPERNSQPTSPLDNIAELQRIDRLSLLDSQITLEARDEAP